MLSALDRSQDFLPLVLDSGKQPREFLLLKINGEREGKKERERHCFHVFKPAFIRKEKTETVSSVVYRFTIKFILKSGFHQFNKR